MKKTLIVIGILSLFIISVLPINSALTNLETIRNTAIITVQSYNPINYPISIDTSLIQNKIIKFISFRDIVDDVLMVVDIWFH